MTSLFSFFLYIPRFLSLHFSSLHYTYSTITYPLFHPSSSYFTTLPNLLLPTVSPPSDEAYLQAADIFQRLRPEKSLTHQLLHYAKKTDTPLPESGDKTTQRQAYQLAFNTLKCMPECQFNYCVCEFLKWATEDNPLLASFLNKFSFEI